MNFSNPTRPSRLRIRQHAWTTKVVTCLVALLQALLPFNGQIWVLTSRASAAPDTARASALPGDFPNRTVPNVAPPSHDLNFSAEPTDPEIFSARVFPSPVVPDGGVRSA